jgi:hypothetical protein
MLREFEYALLVDRAVIGSIPQDIVEIGSGLRDVACAQRIRASSRAFAHLGELL